jgi:Tol biopolymer transport system component
MELERFFSKDRPMAVAWALEGSGPSSTYCARKEGPMAHAKKQSRSRAIKGRMSRILGWLGAMALGACGSTGITGPGDEVHQLVFVRDNQIFASGAGGTNLKPLVEPGDYFSPMWSRSGNEVFFLRRVYENGFQNSTVYLLVVDKDGRSELELLQSPISTAMDRSPDGLKLLYLTSLDIGGSEQQAQIFDTQSRTVVTIPPVGTERFFAPGWGPQNDRFYVSRLVGGQWDIVEYDVNGGEGTPVAADPSANEIYVSASPDGQWLAYFSDSEGETRLFVQSTSPGLVRKLTDLARTARQVVWSPDSSRLAFTGNSQIYTIQPDGQGLVQLTTIPSGYQLQSWSPSGRSLGFRANLVSTPIGIDSYEFYVIDAGGGEAQQVLDLAFDMDVVWAAP